MTAMTLFPLLALSLLLPLYVTSETKLNAKYYEISCPSFEKIVEVTVANKQITSPTTAAATLRLFAHDCMIDGCDGSVLISSNAFNTAERDADINLSLPGDAFDLVVRTKTALELSCPGIVSCSDILALATRDLVTMVGGPYYPVRFGRKDGLVSRAERVEALLPRSNHTMDHIISLFAAIGFTTREMVALTGAHTIGFSHCKEFTDRLYDYEGSGKSDPAYHPKYASGLRKMCENYTTDSSMSAFNDAMTPSKFDNMFFQNLPRGLGLLKSDHALFTDARTKPVAELYARDEMAFFDDFAKAMEKLSEYGIKTGNKGEVRRRCDAFNSIKT